MNEVCQQLKETRQARGLSLDEVAQRTYIKVDYLEALEEGHLDKLPAPVHTFGYIRLYAKLLGLDGGALVSRFQASQGPGAPFGTPTRAAGADWNAGTSPYRESVTIQQAAAQGGKLGSPRGVSLSQLMSGTRAELSPLELSSEAERQARQLIQGAEAYANQVLGTLEAEIEKALQIVRNGRQFIQLRRQPAPEADEA